MPLFHTCWNPAKSVFQWFRLLQLWLKSLYCEQDKDNGTVGGSASDSYCYQDTLKLNAVVKLR